MNNLTLIETLRFTPESGFRNLERHRARMESSARLLGLPFDADLFEARLNEVPDDEGARRVRLELFGTGPLVMTHAAFAPVPAGTVWKLMIARSVMLSSEDPLLRHKTSRRGHYEAARAEFPTASADDVLMLNERGEICEGTITSLFLPDGAGGYLTPALDCGLLAGVERQSMIDSGLARETILKPGDLEGRDFFVGNSLRGLIPARLRP